MNTEKKITRRILSLLTLIILFIAVGALLKEAMVPVTYSLFHNHSLANTAAEAGGHFDVLFVGASRTQRDIDPAVIVKAESIDSAYNASNGLQRMGASYYHIVELIDRFHPDTIVLDINSNRVSGKNSELSNLIMLDRLHGFNKFSFARSFFHGTEQWLRVLLPLYRFRQYADIGKIRDNLQTKAELRANGWSLYRSDGDDYHANGFVYANESMEMAANKNKTFSADKLNSANMRYLNQIIDLCKKNNIRLILTTYPVSMLNLYYYKNYQEEHDFFTAFAKSKGVAYYDLNLLRDRELWFTDELMYDAAHANGKGAEELSSRYAQILENTINGKDVSPWFYESFDDLKKDVRRIPAIIGKASILDGTARLKVESRQNEGITPLYRFEVSTNQENYKLLSDWSGNTQYEFDARALPGTVWFRFCVKGDDGTPGKCSVVEAIH